MGGGFFFLHRALLCLVFGGIKEKKKVAWSSHKGGCRFFGEKKTKKENVVERLLGSCKK